MSIDVRPVSKRGSVGTPPESGTYRKVVAKVTDLPNPACTAHRGGASTGGDGLPVGPFPENTPDGFRGCIAAGTPAINFDVYKLADGLLGCMHDSTVDRTTTATGNVTDQNIQSWLTLVNDAGSYHSAPWGNLKCPTFDQVIAEFGGRVVLVPEMKNTGSGAAATAKIVALRLEQSFIVQSFFLAELAAAAAAGIAVQYLPPDEGNTGSTAAEILAANPWPAGGTKYIGIRNSSSDAYKTSLTAAGLQWMAYFGAGHRYDYEHNIALGAVGTISDDPLYEMLRTGPVYTGSVDPMTFGMWPHGLLGDPGGNGRGVLNNGGHKLTYAGLFDTVVGGLTFTADTWTRTVDITFDTVATDTTKWLGIGFGAADDRGTSLQSAGVGRQNMYTVLVRPEGVAASGAGRVQVFKDVGGGVNSSTQVGGNLALPNAIASGDTVRVVIQKTATQIIVTVSGTAGHVFAPVTLTVTESAYTGRYWHHCKGATASQNVQGTYKIISTTYP